MKALPKQYQSHARTMLKNALNAQFTDMAPRNNMPYVRAELQFPSDGPESGASHAIRIQGLSTPLIPRIDSEIRAFADAMRDAVAYALNDSSYTVEAVVLSGHGDQPGTHVSLFIYDNKMGSYEHLYAKLQNSRQAILQRFESLCPSSPDSPHH